MLEASGGRMAEGKKGYSIWSLLVTMTLLAVWMAVREGGQETVYHAEIIFVVHQLVALAVVGSLLWTVTGDSASWGYSFHLS